MQTTTIVIIAAVLIFLVFTIVKAPIKLIFKFLLNTVVGFVTLFVLNFLGGLIGVSLDVNWINAAVIGVFGVPGIALLLLLQWLMII